MNSYKDKIKGLNKPRVLGEQVCQNLIDAILGGTLKQGDQLVEMELQKHFNISRSPLREAFRALESKGLVEIIPHRGAFVRSITVKDIKEHFAIAAVLEGVAAKTAYSKMTTKDLDRMKNALALMEKSGDKTKKNVYRENHLLFHDTFIIASGNDLLINMINNLRIHRMWYYVSYQYHHEYFEKGLKIHQKILELFECKNTDVNELERVVRFHIEEFVERFLGYIHSLKKEV